MSPIGHTARIRRMAVALIVAGAVGLPAIAADGPSVTLNFRDAEITEVISVVGEITGKTIIVDPQVQGRVTVISNQPLDRRSVWETFLSILEVQNLAVVESGDTVKVIQEQNFRTKPGAEMSRRGEIAPDDVITRVVALEHVPAAQVVPPLRPLASQYGHLAAYPAANIIIMTDRSANVDRLLQILRRIDQAGEQAVEVIPMEHASATEVVRMVTTLRQSSGQTEGGAMLSIIADERTNSVLISGDKNERLRARTLITHLDTPLDGNENTQVVYLRYAEAEKMAETLNNFVTGQTQTQGSGGQGGAPRPSAENQANILPDPDTNALVITAQPELMRKLQSVIAKLDIRRAQVLVEAILVEVTADRSGELGVTWVVDNVESGGTGAITNFGGTGAGVAQIGEAASSGDASSASVPDGVTLGVGKVDSDGSGFAGILRALAGDSTSNILSTPTIVTLDNEEAEIKVGQEVPFVTGQFTNTGGTGGSVNPFQTINREEVGITLKITPQINEGDSVRLKIEQEASSLSTGSSSAVDLITNKRTIKTSVIVGDGEIIVLGGLIDDTTIENEQRVPGLGRIPLLGNLFKYRKASKVKRNLMVFLRPVILRDGVDAAFETDSKYRYMQDEQRRSGSSAIRLLEDQQPAELPAIDLRDVRPEDRSEDAPEDGDG